MCAIFIVSFMYAVFARVPNETRTTMLRCQRVCAADLQGTGYKRCPPHTPRGSPKAVPLSSQARLPPHFYVDSRNISSSTRGPEVHRWSRLVQRSEVQRYTAAENARGGGPIAKNPTSGGSRTKMPSQIQIGAFPCPNRDLEDSHAPRPTAPADRLTAQQTVELKTRDRNIPDLILRTSA